MKIGVAYYPEHWPEDRWATDARMMKDMGIDVVRVGEFAWSRLEPRRDQYDMLWLERAIQTLAAEGLEVILGTPTAAPPTWLFDRHPQIVPVDEIPCVQRVVPMNVGSERGVLKIRIVAEIEDGGAVESLGREAAKQLDEIFDASCLGHSGIAARPFRLRSISR